MDNSEQIYQQLVENIHDVLFVVSTDWQTIYYVNSAYEDVWGKTCESLIEKPLSWMDSLHPDDINHIMKYIKEKSTTGDPTNINVPDYRVIRPDGSCKWVKTRGFPILNDKGEIYRIAGLAVDITEQKENEEKIKLREERLNMVLEGSQQGFWDWNIETGEVYRNDRWARMLGYSSIKDFDNNTDTWTNSIHPDDRDIAWSSINDHLEGRTPCHDLEYRMFTKDGEYRWIHDHAKVVQRDSKGAPLRMSGTHTDITERKKLENEKDVLVASLKEALSEIKALRGIIPICSYCHSIRNEEGAWDEMLSYISNHTNAKFSHGICPKCLPKVRAKEHLDE